MACTDMAILEHNVVKSYGSGVYRRSRLLGNAAKEMGYTALRDKPEKEAVFLGKDVFVSVQTQRRFFLEKDLNTCVQQWS